MEVFFLPNGNTAVFDPEQVPPLQEPWIVVFAEWLEAKGIDPLTVTWLLPDGRRARLFRVTGELPRLSWELLP